MQNMYNGQYLVDVNYCFLALGEIAIEGVVEDATFAQLFLPDRVCCKFDKCSCIWDKMTFEHIKFLCILCIFNIF